MAIEDLGRSLSCSDGVIALRRERSSARGCLRFCFSSFPSASARRPEMLAFRFPQLWARLLPVVPRSLTTQRRPPKRS